MNNTVRTTHVGSLPRAQEVVDLIFAREHGKPYDAAKFTQTMTRNVNATVEKQVNAGIDIVSDGETSKISYATYVKDRYHGFSGDSERNAPADLKLFPDFLEKLAQQGGTPDYSRPVCSGEVSKINDDDLNADISNLTQAIENRKDVRGFMNAASPGVISLFLPNQFYPSREKYLEKLGDVMREEYHKIVDAGLLLQLDCPDLALSRHMLFPEMSDDDFVKIAQMHVEILNDSIKDIDPAMIRVHICWGNYEGPHVCDISMGKMFDTLMSVNAQHLLFETSNPRHAHEWTIFRDRKNDIPDDKILVPGVIDSTTNFVEHPELVAQRIRHFTDIVGSERVIAGSDCGFGTFAGFGAVAPDIAYAKLKALSDGAALVT